MVYFIRGTHTGRIKIGTSNNPVRRLKALRTGSPEPLRLLGAILGGHNRERELHHQFGRFAMHGEWFDGDLELLRAIGEMVELPIREWLICAEAEIWLINGTAWIQAESFAQPTRRELTLYCILRHARRHLPPDSNEMLAAVLPGHQFVSVDVVFNARTKPRHIPRNRDVLREPLTNSRHLAWVGIPQLGQGFLPVREASRTADRILPPVGLPEGRYSSTQIVHQGFERPF